MQYFTVNVSIHLQYIPEFVPSFACLI